MPAAHLDEPPAERQQQACSACGKEHIRTRPQRLGDGEPGMPRVTGNHAYDSGKGKAAQFLPQAGGTAQKFSRERSQERGCDRRKGAQRAFRVEVAAVEVAEHQLAIKPSGNTTMLRHPRGVIASRYGDKPRDSVVASEQSGNPQNAAAS